MDNIIAELNKINPNLEIMSIISDEFREFGSEVDLFSLEELKEYMDRVEIPTDRVVYVPSVAEMEETGVFCLINKILYGGQPVQIGYCTGDNSRLDGLEYHKGSEIVYALTDLVLLLGHVWDIENNLYSSKNVEAFFVPAGKAVELYSTTLHFAPCKVHEEGFKAVIVLPEGTNCPLEIPEKCSLVEDRMLFMKNKWLLVHPDAQELIEQGACIGINGENIELHI